MDVRLPNGTVIRGVPEGTSKDEVMQKAIAGGYAKPEDFGMPAEEPSFYQQMKDNLVGGLDAAAAVGSRIVAEPVAGIAGMAAAMSPLRDEGAGGQTVNETREALAYQPRTERGQEMLQGVGETLAPVGEAISAVESGLGDATFDATGSPALAAMATAAPTAALEALGLGAVKRGSSVSVMKQADDLLKEATPSQQMLKDTANALYTDIDNMGAAVRPKAFSRMVQEIEADAIKMGIDPDITPSAWAALNRLKEKAEAGQSVPTQELDTLRQVVSGAASKLDEKNGAIAVGMRETMDSFLDNAGETVLESVENASEVGAKYKKARDLWGRYRRSELLDEAFYKAQNQASGFENGIRIQFRQLLQNKKSRKQFKKHELEAMEKVVRGGKAENALRLLGRLAPGEGQATNMLGASVGAAGGAAAFGPAGAVAVPAAGYIARQTAQRITANNGRLAQKLVEAGADARKIAQAYVQSVPKSQRNVEDLTNLLMGVDPSTLNSVKQPLVRDAAKEAAKRQAALGAAATTGASKEGAVVQLPRLANALND